MDRPRFFPISFASTSYPVQDSCLILSVSARHQEARSSHRLEISDLHFSADRAIHVSGGLTRSASEQRETKTTDQRYLHAGAKSPQLFNHPRVHRGPLLSASFDHAHDLVQGPLRDVRNFYAVGRIADRH